MIELYQGGRGLSLYGTVPFIFRCVHIFKGTVMCARTAPDCLEHRSAHRTVIEAGPSVEKKSVDSVT